MTKRQRAQVVELLRCAADVAGPGQTQPIGLSWAIKLRDPTHTNEWHAWSAYDAVKTDRVGEYRAELLEAAQRVEEGSWP